MNSNFSFFTGLIGFLLTIMSIIMMLGYVEVPARIDLFFFSMFGFIASIILVGLSVLHMKLEEIEAKQ